jgi:hypothetical protein
MAGHGDRRAEARGALEKGAEAKGDQQELDAPIGRDATDRALQQLETALLDAEAVEKEDVEHDPADRKEAGHQPEHRGPQRQARRHGEAPDRDDDGSAQGDDGGDVRLHLARRDQRQQHHDGNRRDQGRQQFVGERIVDLIPHGLPPPDFRCRRLGTRARKRAIEIRVFGASPLCTTGSVEALRQ